jgi:hypothetical protein
VKAQVLIPFSYDSYNRNYVYVENQRAINGKISLQHSLSSWDAQWYLRITETGYSNVKSVPKGTIIPEQLNYIFFPLYPFLIRMCMVIFQSPILSAFVLSHILMFLILFSAFYIGKKTNSEQLGGKFALILLFSPFSVYFRSYYPESLLLLLIMWFGYFIYMKKFLASSILLSLINITKGNAALINILYQVDLFKHRKKFGTIKYLALSFISFFSVSIWIVFSYIQSGDFLYLIHIREAWLSSNNGIITLVHHALTFPIQWTHTFGSSQIEIIMVLITGLVILNMRDKIPKKYQLISLSLYLLPIFLNGEVSFSRLQLVSFPIFLFIAKVTSDKFFNLLLASSYALMILFSIMFVNWYWVG